MRRDNSEHPSRRKALKTIGSISIATIGFSGAALANESNPDSEDSGEIRIISNTDEKIVMETVYRGETVQITKFKQGPKAGIVQYEGGPQGLDGFSFDTSAQPAPKASTQVNTNVIKRRNTFSKKIGGCHVHNSYKHRFEGGSVELTKNAGALSKATLGQIIGLIIPGGKIGIAVGVVAGFIMNRFGGKNTFTFGQRDYDTKGLAFNVSAAGYGYNVSASKTIPVNAPIPGHIAR